MTPAARIVSWIARKLGMQIVIAGQPLGLVDDEFVAIWEKVRARGISRYTIRCATVAVALIGLAWIPAVMIGGARIGLTIVLFAPLWFVIAALLAPIRWAQHEDRFMRLTAPWLIKRFD